VLRDRSVIRFADQSTLGDEYAQTRDAAVAIGARSSVYVPVPAGGAAVGMCVFRDVVDPFTDDDVTLLQSFAAQAASAVENARRQQELNDALELQTATSEVLRLISDHPGDLHAVMQGLVERAVRLVGGDTGGVARFDGDTLTYLYDMAHPDLVGLRAPLALGFREAVLAPSTDIARIADVQRLVGVLGIDQDMVRDVRSSMIAPLHADGRPFGMLLVGRFEVRPFGERDGEVLQTFAEQSAIAMLNARLFNDLDAALERPTAMTEVLDAVSAARVDLQPFYDVIARQAIRIFGGHPVLIFIRDGAELVEGTPVGAVTDSAGRFSQPGMRWPIDERSLVGYACLTGEIVHVRDWSTMPADVFPGARGRRDDSKASLVVPMLRNGEAVGIVSSMGPHVADVSDAQVALLQTFANQAAIAVDNARLLR
jgi:GAF domain-containing protein